MAVQKTRQTRHWRKTLLVCAALQALGGAAQAGNVVYRVTLLPDLGGQGFSTALAINSAGDVVGSNFEGSNGGPGGSYGSTYAFLYAGGATSRVGPADTNQNRVDDRATALSEARGVMGTTTIAGETGFNSEQRGFVQSYSALTGQIGSSTTFAGPAGFAEVAVHGVNSSRRVVGQASSTGNVHVAFVREADGQVLRLQDFGGRDSVARAVNDAGQMAGSADIPNVGSRAVLWQGGGMVGLGTLGGNNSAAFAISQNGWVVGESDLQTQGQRHAFVWRDGAMNRVAAGLDASGSSRAEAVNALRQVAGVFSNAAGAMDRVFLDSPSGGSVELTGFSLSVHMDSIHPGATQLPMLKINELGQISAGLHGDYGMAMVLSPSGTLSWSQSGGGRVAEPGNWDSGMGFAPNRLLDVVIGTFRDQTITADTTMEAKSLHVTGSKAGRATLQLSGGAIVNALEGVTIEARGRLQGAGRVLGPVVLNHGTVTALPGQLLTLDGGLDNHGLVTGNGRIEANLINRGGGAPGVQVGAGQHLTLAGTAHTAADASRINIRDGGTLAFEGRFVNQGGAVLAIDRGTLQLGYGATRMDNGGQVLVGSGRAEILGDINNTPRGLLHAHDGADLTVWDTLRNDGEVRADTGARIVYALGVSGKGNFTGTDGMHRFEGGYGPGNSAAEVDIGNVQFASLVTLELGGLLAGSQHDRINFTGSARFEETSFLNITLINNFVPHAGDVFALFSYAQAPVGNFEDFYLPGLSAGLSWDVSRIHTTGVLAVTSVPEPSAAALWLAGLAGMGAVARRRARRA